MLAALGTDYVDVLTFYYVEEPDRVGRAVRAGRRAGLLPGGPA